MSSRVTTVALAFSIALPVHAQSATQPAPPASAQSAAAPSAPATYSGCVMESPTEKGTFILNADSVCARLTGKLATSDLTGHQIDLKGVLTPRAGTTPASIAIDSVGHVGKACSDVCSPLPPRTRGLGGERPGREGGRPGLTPDSQPNPQ
jgi:hypothetical protein